MRATTNGRLNPVPKCKISIPGAGRSGGVGVIELNNLPDISDTKNAIYNSEGIMGRSFPLYTYSHSGDRAINMQLHFFIVSPNDGERNLQYLRMLQSAVYPRDGSDVGAPFKPPCICTIQCGDLLSKEPICAALQSYSVKFPTEVAWDETTYCPYRFDVDTNWLVMYTSSDLPFQNRIIDIGR